MEAIPSPLIKKFKLENKEITLREFSAKFIDNVQKGIETEEDLDIIKKFTDISDEDFNNLSITQVKFIAKELYSLSFGDNAKEGEEKKS